MTALYGDSLVMGFDNKNCLSFLTIVYTVRLPGLDMQTDESMHKACMFLRKIKGEHQFAKIKK